MTRRTSDLVVNPLFADALSGGFTPESDPQGRVHTLNRLGVRTVQGGEEQIDENSWIYTYAPSWAPDTLSTVTTNYLPQPRLLVMTSIALRATSGHEESFSFDSVNGRLWLNHERTPRSIQLVVGPQLDEAQAQISAIAEGIYRA